MSGKLCGNILPQPRAYHAKVSSGFAKMIRVIREMEEQVASVKR